MHFHPNCGYDYANGKSHGMKNRILVSSQLYFGLDPVVLRRGTERALARIGGVASDHVRVTARSLREDFRVDPAEGDALLRALVTGGLLEAEHGSTTDYRLTERFYEYAQARIVPPLSRTEAKGLIDQVCKLAAQINADWTWNPVTIDMIGVSGGYMSRSDKIAELNLWPVVRVRAEVRPRRLRQPISKAQGSAEVRTALRALNGFIFVHLVTDTASIERPFSVPFRANEGATASSLATARLLDWSSSIRRQLTGTSRR